MANAFWLNVIFLPLTDFLNDKSKTGFAEFIKEPHRDGRNNCQPAGPQENKLAQAKQGCITLGDIGDITDLCQHNPWQETGQRRRNFA